MSKLHIFEAVKRDPRWSTLFREQQQLVVNGINAGTIAAFEDGVATLRRPEPGRRLTS